MEIGEAVEALIAIFIVIILAIFLYPIINQLSPQWALVFIVAAVLIVISVIRGLGRD
jgi:hypothetical protein